MSEAVLPIVKSVFLCDDVAIDQQTGKPSVTGLFNSLRVEFLAGAVSVIDEFCVFAEFVGGIAPATVRIEITRARTNTVVVRTTDRTLRFRGRHTTLAVSFRIENLAVPEPGVYLVELYCNDVFVDDRLLRITAREETGS